MNIQQLQYFVTICRYNNFTKAAEALNLSQPGISFAMKELEKECELKLFDRKKNSNSVPTQMHQAGGLLSRTYGHVEQALQSNSVFKALF